MNDRIIDGRTITTKGAEGNTGTGSARILAQPRSTDGGAQDPHHMILPPMILSQPSTLSHPGPSRRRALPVPLGVSRQCPRVLRLLTATTEQG